MALNKTGIDALQAYWLAHSNDIYTKTFEEPSNSNFMSVTVKDKLLLPNGSSTEMLQGYQPGHTAKGNVNLSGRMLDMRMVKVDQTFETRRFDADYYYSFMNRSGNDPRQFPYEAWVMTMIMNQMYEDYTLEALWGGVYVAPTPPTPNNAADIMDGFKELIDVEVTALTLTPTVTGAIAAGTAVDQIRTFVKSNLDVPGKRNRLHYIYTSLDVVDKYQEDYESTYGTVVTSDNPYQLMRVHGTNALLVPQAGLTGDELIMARPDNFWVGFDGAPHVEMDYESRYLKVEVDWKVGCQFSSVEELYINDQL